VVKYGQKLLPAVGRKACMTSFMFYKQEYAKDGQWSDDESTSENEKEDLF